MILKVLILREGGEGKRILISVCMYICVSVCIGTCVVCVRCGMCVGGVCVWVFVYVYVFETRQQLKF